MNVKKLIELVESLGGADHYKISAEVAAAQKEEDAIYLEEQGYTDLANELRNQP